MTLCDMFEYDFFGHLTRESIRLEYPECFLSVNFFSRRKNLLDLAFTTLKGTTELLFFFMKRLQDSIFLFEKFRVGTCVVRNDNFREDMGEVLRKIESASCAYSTTDKSTDEVSCIDIGWKCSISDEECRSTEVIHDDTKCSCLTILSPVCFS